MTNTYLLEVIKALSPTERQELALFVSSPLFNKSEEAVLLYQVIMRSSPTFDTDALSKEQVYFEVFSDTKIVSGKLEKLMTELNKLVRHFILTKQYLSEKNEDVNQALWANWLLERNLGDRSAQVMAKLKSRNTQRRQISLESLKAELLIAETEHLWESTFNRVKGDLKIPRLLSILDLYYQIYRTELSNRYLLQQKGGQLPDLIVPSREEMEESSEFLQIVQLIHQLLNDENPSTNDFEALRVKLRNAEPLLEKETFASLNAYLRNICTILVNRHPEFVQVLHEIHKDNLERGYFLFSGKMLPNAFLNLVNVAIKVKACGWAKEFAETYKNRLVIDVEEDFYYRLALAQCYFGEGNFNEALNHIPDVPSASYYHHIVRRLELKIYYELHSDLLHYKMFAFRKYVERTAPKTISANIRTMDLNFLNILLQLSQSPIKDRARSAKLIERIEKKQLLSDRGWLLEKAQALA